MIISLEEINFLEDYRNHSEQIWRQKDLSNQISFANDWHSIVTPMFQSCSQRSCSPNPLRCLFPARTVLGECQCFDSLVCSVFGQRCPCHKILLIQTALSELIIISRNLSVGREV